MLFEYDPFWVIFWYLAFLYWVLHTSPNTHQIPIIISIIQYYLEIKQRTIETRMRRLEEKLQKRSANLFSVYDDFVEINHRQILFEICFQQYNRRLKIYLTIIVMFYTILVTYLIYILFLSDLPYDYIPIYVLLLTTHSSLMILLIVHASRISTRDRQYNHWNQTILPKIICKQRKFLNRMRYVTQDRMPMWKNEFKFSTITACMSRRPLGFTLLNNYLITSNTLFDVSI
ncbi:hypothetical protein QR98_0024210 [Sarcoptes scabiei]|uniref:Gustatory receptor n=1 Tax=Sarcoptes scabiei TaxID=52283 RepID=A0A131ZYP9_SARSC|nr:hypothetical protein QR98_0024210 [Sarcoptes scabiei]